MDWNVVDRGVAKCRTVKDLEDLIKSAGRSDVANVFAMALKQFAAGRIYRAKRNADERAIIREYRKTHPAAK